MKKVLYALFAIACLAFIIPIAVLAFRPSLIHPKSEVKQKLVTQHSCFLNWRGAEIHYTDEGAGYPLLLIHGFGGHFRNFKDINDELAKDYRVIRVDLPGFGLSDCPPVDPANPQYVKLYREFFEFFLDTLHLDSLYVAGNSMGGMVGWNLAVDQPEKVKKLVLLASAGYDLEKTAKGLFIIRFKSLAKAMEKGLPEFMSVDGARRCYADDSRVRMEEVQFNNLVTNREGNIRHMLQMAGDLNFPDTARIQQVACPTLIIWGTQDEIIPVAQADRFHRDIKNSELVIFDSCGHLPMVEKLEETHQLMVKFLGTPINFTPAIAQSVN